MTFQSRAVTTLLLCGVCLNPFDSTFGDDHFLVIGGGYAPTTNQASLEKNVLYFQRVVSELRPGKPAPDVLFADGFDQEKDLQVNDPEAVPLPNRLMAEFFGTERELGMSYRSHEVPGILGASSPENLAKWFREVGSALKPGDRLLLYVTSHGGESSDKSDEYNTTIYMWDNKRITVREFVRQLDLLPKGVSVVTVMVQCHAGGFARAIFEDAVADNPLSDQDRCGFFATVHDRSAAGCTPDIDEADYQEYSSFFWAAISGRDRLGNTISRPDYDGDGQVSFSEAHAYTVITSETIDLPIRSSGEYLRVRSRFRDDEHPDLLAKDVSWDALLPLAGPVQLEVLERLSEQLELQGDDRITAARAKLKEQTSSRRGRFTGRRPGTGSAAGRLRQQITSDIRKQWPELANVLSPVATELLTTRSDEFIRAIESHPKYAEYRRERQKEREASAGVLSPEEKRVRYERFLREAENVILAHNLQVLAVSEHVREFERLVAAESGILSRVAGP